MSMLLDPHCGKGYCSPFLRLHSEHSHHRNPWLRLCCVYLQG